MDITIISPTVDSNTLNSDGIDARFGIVTN